jgi:hypothetical protein
MPESSGPAVAAPRTRWRGRGQLVGVDLEEDLEAAHDEHAAAVRPPVVNAEGEVAVEIAGQAGSRAPIRPILAYRLPPSLARGWRRAALSPSFQAPWQNSAQLRPSLLRFSLIHDNLLPGRRICS